MIRHIVPWKATDPGDVTLLRAPGRRLTKLITPAGVEPAETPALFEVDAIRIDCIDDLPGVLLDLAARRDTVIIRAVLKAPIDPHSQIRRQLHDHGNVAGRFAEVARSWLMIDIEPEAAPGWVDPSDPIETGGWLRRQLPPPFQRARCVVALSAGAAFKRGLRAHLWFMTARALVNAELDRLLGGVAGVDPATFRPVQIHYTADPVFDGVDDPCIQGRIVVLPGYAEVAVPELAPAPVRAAFAPAEAHTYAAASRGLLFRATRPEKYMVACLEALAATPAGARHPAIVRVSARLFGLAQGGALDPVVVIGRIRCIAEPWGDLSEVDRILSWSWEHARPWRLPL